MNRINLICLGVKSVKASLAFYKNIGFKTHEKENNPPIVFFDTQGSKLSLYSLDELAKDINSENPPTLSSGSFSGITLACNMKSKQEVDAALALVEMHGGKIVKSAQTASWGGYSAYFQDLDGHYWEVAYAEFWQFDENDMLILS